MIHAEEGETVVPMEVLDRNPVLKKRLFKSMKALGIDPGRYIVGNDLNSLNPVTGQPEFFLKWVGSRLRKAAADVSGYAAPIVGAMYGPGWGAATGAMLGQYKRENPGDPSQWAQMAGRGAMAGIASNVLGGHPMFKGKGLGQTYGYNPMDIFSGVVGSPMQHLKTGDKYNILGGGGDVLTADEKVEIESILSKTKSQLTMGEELLYDKYTNSLKTDFLGGASIQDLAVKYGLTVAIVGKVLEETTSDEDAGTRVAQYKPHGLDYEWAPATVDYGYPTALVAEGGIMDLQGGGESRGPGTGTSDSIPAMLSDGEFVMTADAVRGAGGGDRREGARRMYEAMDRLEARA